MMVKESNYSVPQNNRERKDPLEKQAPEHKHQRAKSIMTSEGYT